MKDVTAFLAHGFPQTGRRLPMSQGEIDYELLSQVFDLTAADAKVTSEQFLDDLCAAAVSQEKGFANKNHHIITKAATTRCQTVQVLSGIDRLVLAIAALQEGFVGGKASQVQGVERFGSRLVNRKGGSTIGTMDPLRAKG
jgi:hypothetical protein